MARSQHKRSRFWTYSREDWDPDHRWVPYFGGDEWHRRTVVLPIPFGGYLVVALWAPRKCEICEEYGLDPKGWNGHEDPYI